MTEMVHGTAPTAARVSDTYRWTQLVIGLLQELAKTCGSRPLALRVELLGQKIRIVAHTIDVETKRPTNDTK